MGRRRVEWADAMMTWPSFTVKINLLPWQWRLVPRGWYDYSPGYEAPVPSDSRAGWWGVTAQWLAFEVDFGFNLPPFTLPGDLREEVATDA